MTPSQRLARESREWIAHRHWKPSPYGPALSGLAVTAAPGGFMVVDITAASPTPVTPAWPVPEYAKRYVEHVHNFGRPPY
jgi:hypothetical protein